MKKILTLLLAFTAPLLVFGQSPGGVAANLRVWLKADNGFTPSAWADHSGNANTYTQTNAARQPFVASVFYNFNPVVDFGGAASADGRFMAFPSGGPFTANGLSATYFTLTLTRTGGTSGYRDIWGFNGTTTTASLTNANSPTVTKLNNDIVLYDTTTSAFSGQYADNQFLLSDISYTVNVAGIKYGLNGAIATVNQTRSTAASLQANGSILGSQPEVMNGLMGEMIAYERDLTPAEKIRVRTYTSLKYGITLPHDYVSASSQVIWNNANNSAYSNNIAGIARDNLSALHQKQSRSINSGQKLIIGNGNTLSETNVLNGNSLTDGQSLIWGDNGLKQVPNISLANPAAPGGGTNFRFASVWKAQNTGNVGTVTVAWPAGLKNIHLVRSSDATIDAGDAFIPMSGTTTVNGITYNTATVTFNDGDYFTFAAYVHAPGGVVSSLWYRADKGLAPSTGAVTSWTDYSYSQVPVAPALSTITSAPASVDGTGLNLNFNPGLTFVAANALGNTNTLNALSGTNYTIYTTTTPVTGNGYDRIVGINYAGLTGGAGYDSPGFGAENIILRNSSGGGVLNATNATGYRYNQLTNTTIVRNTFTNTLFTRALNGATAGGNITYGTTSATPDGGILFGRNANNGGDDNGAGMTMAETIVFDAALSANDINKIDSYLAIKGGITLNNANTPNYLSSSSTPVWNGSTNAGYNNNILGIAYDYVSDLHQKQSKSINDGQKLIVGNGNGLFNTNILNTNTLAEGQFLMIGDNGLKQAPAIALSNPTAPGGGINYRFASVWKVQNTGNVGTVTIAWPATGMENFHLIRSTDSTIDVTDTFVAMTGTTTVNGVTYNTANVSLADGNYFTFAAYVHAPGGVLSSLWYRADKGLAPAAGAVTTWTDYSVGQVPVSPVLSSATSAPSSVDGIGLNFNFNPAVTFAAANALGNTEILNPTTGGNYTIYTSTTAATGDRIVGLGYSNLTGGANYDSPGIGADVVGLRNAAGSIILSYSAANGYKYTQFTNTTIARNIFTNTNFSRALNGDVAGAGSTYTSTTTGPDGGIIFGRNANGGGDDAGSALTMGETIVFDGVLSANDVNRIDSYLAIKGGITLNTTNTPNYLSSSSANIWNGSANTGFNNNIFGIANDFLSALHQKQSKSINGGQRLIIGAGGALANTNALNTNNLTNGQFLIVGDNGLRQGLSVPISGIAGINYRFESVWKAQNTGSVGTVRVAWPSGLTSLRIIQSNDTTFDGTDTATDMYANTQTINGVTYNYADVTLANGQYFTFAAFAHAPGGVVNGLSQWYRADIDATNTGNGSDVTSWKDYFGGTISGQIAGKALPKYKIGDAASFNFNPGLSFTAITQTLGNNTVQTISNINVDVFTFTKQGMTSPSSPNPHFFSITEDNAVTSIAAWDYLGLYPNASIERRIVGGGTQILGSGINFSTTIPSIMYNTFTNTSFARGLNGAANGTTVATGAVGLGLGGHVFGDTRWTGNTSDNGGIVGDIGETIIYGGGNITVAERRKVDTYLAVKYGITLGRVATDNYISSTDATIWNGAFNTTYNNNVFGLAKDDISALHQKVSKSANAGTILTMATNNDFISQNIDASRTALTGDQKYFLLGDNNITATPMTAASFITGTNAKVIQKNWLVQRTGGLNGVYFQADLSAYESQFYPSNLVYMVVADDASFATNRVLVQGTKVSGKWEFNYNFDSENTKRYITFSTFENAVSTACYKPGAVASTGNPALPSKIGVTSLTRTPAMSTADNFPAVRTGAWMVLEAKTKGFVVNRLAFNGSGNPVGIPPANFVEGMLLYDTTNKCLKMYTSQDGGTTFAWYCVTTQTCPD